MSYYFENETLKFNILEQFNWLKAGFSTKRFGNLGFKNSTPESRFQSRKIFFDHQSLNISQAVFQDQQHTNNIKIVTQNHIGKGIKYKKNAFQNNDGMITDENNLILTAAAADCTPVYIIEPQRKIIALVHSGREGTRKKITTKAIQMIQKNFNIETENLIVILGPAICEKCYEINDQITEQFEEKHCLTINNRIYLNVKTHIIDELHRLNIRNIENINICTFENELYYSYREEGLLHGTGIGFMMIKREN